MKHILLTNDDGIDANGLYALYKELKKLGEVTVVAPHVERSAVGHAITISEPIRVLEFNRVDKFHGYAVLGTPADCVKIAIKKIMARKPDVVVSGINHGSNTATNILYSGTVSAATEGIIMGVPSLAASLTSFDLKSDMSLAAEFTARMVARVLEKGLPPDTLLNINVPSCKKSDVKGVMVTRQGKGRYEEYFEQRTDLSGRAYYWLTGKKMNLDTEDDVDDVAVSKNQISVTPVHIDMTNYRMLEVLKTWNITA
jgi:5'-nucleotidase